MRPGAESVSVGRALRAAVVLVAASLAVSTASAEDAKLAVTLTAPVNGAVYLAPATIPLAATVTVLRGKEDDRDKDKDKDKLKPGDKDQDKKDNKDKDKKNDQDEHGNPHERVVKVDFLQGATVIGTATAVPYAFNWVNVPAGNYVLTARATNAKGETVSSAPVTIIVNAAPTVAITAPAPNAVVTAPATITLTAAAADSDGTVAKVDFFQGATLIGTAAAAPYTFTWINVAAGSYSLTAVATDNRDASTTSAAVPIRVNAVPTVSLTSPADSATFTAPADIPLAANASDSDGTIAKVEFYNGSTLITTLTAAPFSVIWTGVPLGSYTLTAKATDNQGATTTSAAVNVTVNTGVAQLYFIHTDHLNTPRVITNQVGQAVWRYDNTDPFGGNPPEENPSGLGNFTCNLRFPGQYFDKESNTHYNYFRDYDSSIGRYVQSDPIGLAGGINTYAYGAHNPLSFTDFFGLQTYMCTQPLHALGGTGLRSGPDIWGNPFYHKYICVPDGNGGMVCGGQDREGGPFSKGKPSVDTFKAESCSVVEPANDCIEKCLRDEIQDSTRPPYWLFGGGGRNAGGQNCQQWADLRFDRCRQKCAGGKK